MRALLMLPKGPLGMVVLVLVIFALASIAGAPELAGK